MHQSSSDDNVSQFSYVADFRNHVIQPKPRRPTVLLALTSSLRWRRWAHHGAMFGALSNRRNWHTRASLLPSRWRSEWQRCWSPAQGLAGLIAKYHPRLQIANRAKDGTKFANFTKQLVALGGQHFDAILVLGGGKNVIRLTGQKALTHAVLRTAQLARTHGKFVVIVPSGNAGNASFFVASLSWLMSRRSRNLHTLVRIAASDNGAPYVNLYKEKAEDPFAQRADELNAKDGTTKYWAVA